MEIHCCSYAPLLPVSDLSPHSVRLAPAEMQSQRIPGRKRGRPSLHSTPMKMAVHNLYSASAGSLPAVKIPKKRGRKPGYKIKSRVLMTPLALSPPRSTPEPDLSSIPQDAATVPSLAAPQALTVCLYINKQANAGPYLERRKVQQLPEHFGPERPSAVLQQAVQACIDCAHQQKLVFSLVKQGYGGEMVSVSASFDGKQHLRSLPVVNSVGYVLRFLAKLCRSLLCDDLFSHQPFPRGCSASEKVQEKEEGRMESGASVKGCTQGRKPSVSVTRKSLRDSQQKAPLHPTAPSTCWKPGVPQRRAGEAAGWRRHNHQAKTVTTEEYLVNPVGMNRYGMDPSASTFNHRGSLPPSSSLYCKRQNSGDSHLGGGPAATAGGPRTSPMSSGGPSAPGLRPAASSPKRNATSLEGNRCDHSPSAPQLRTAEERRPQAKESGSLHLATLWAPQWAGSVFCGKPHFSPEPRTLPPVTPTSRTHEPFCMIQDPPHIPFQEPHPTQMSMALTSFPWPRMERKRKRGSREGKSSAEPASDFNGLQSLCLSKQPQGFSNRA
ncbi:sex comb on midleg-like protein 4 isoform X6 [Papio anubis]|uniref:sex comb on midleg-like protein 4 isoform X6 n=1 Tax=Papio anubis TaxID=9555 RepID=UPI000B7B6C37|nr:sex comb on midleg-like protein 4 isoform X6 [Papio anubis]